MTSGVAAVTVVAVVLAVAMATADGHAMASHNNLKELKEHKRLAHKYVKNMSHEELKKLDRKKRDAEKTKLKLKLSESDSESELKYLNKVRKSKEADGQDYWDKSSSPNLLLKHAPAYMKEGRTLEERRQQKKLRLRLKREADDKEATRTQTKGLLKGKHGWGGEDIARRQEGYGGDPEYSEDTFRYIRDLHDSFIPVAVDEGSESSDQFADSLTDVNPIVPIENNDISNDIYYIHTNPTTATPATLIPFTYKEPSVTSGILESNAIDSTDASEGHPHAEDSAIPVEVNTMAAFPSSSASLTTQSVETTPHEEETTNVPWPWIDGSSDAEQCGQTRFGPEVRRNTVEDIDRMAKILNGKEALPGAFPWAVTILDSDRDMLCGGTIVAQRWVMTAAHCIRKRLYVRLQEHHIKEKDGYEIEQKVRRMYRHPDYNSSTIDNDMALLRLPALPNYPHPSTGMMAPGTVDRACLPSNEEDFPSVGTRCLVMGWGKASTSHSFGTDVLMYTLLPIISRKACIAANRRTITENMFCAGHYKGGADTCSGDSGGPLVCANRVGGQETWTLYGVTSFGDGCGAAGKMGAYTKVNRYLDWIAGIMRKY